MTRDEIRSALIEAYRRGWTDAAGNPVFLMSERAAAQADEILPPIGGERCDACRRLYDDVYHLPDDIWRRIHPRAPAGLLCPRCRHRYHDGPGNLVRCASGDTPSGYGCECRSIVAPAPAATTAREALWEAMLVLGAAMFTIDDALVGAPPAEAFAFKRAYDAWLAATKEIP